MASSPVQAQSMRRSRPGWGRRLTSVIHSLAPQHPIVAHVLISKCHPFHLLAHVRNSGLNLDTSSFISRGVNCQPLSIPAPAQSALVSRVHHCRVSYWAPSSLLPPSKITEWGCQEGRPCCGSFSSFSVLPTHLGLQSTTPGHLAQQPR